MGGLFSPQMDFIFKQIFGNEQNPEILVSFLNAILTPVEKIISVEIRNPEVNKQHLDDKYSRLDILAVTDKYEIVNIEMQMVNKGDMIPRTLFYLGKKYVQQLEEGEKYKKLARTICINVLSFNLLDEVDYHSTYRFCNLETHKELSDLQEIHFIELKKIKSFDLENPLEQWLEFLNMPHSVVKRELLEEPLKTASHLLQKLSASKEERERYEYRENCLREELSALDHAEERGKQEGLMEGLKKGLEQGREEALLSVVNALRSTHTPQQISEITGLSLNEIQDL